MPEHTRRLIDEIVDAVKRDLNPDFELLREDLLNYVKALRGLMEHSASRAMWIEKRLLKLYKTVTPGTVNVPCAAHVTVNGTILSTQQAGAVRDVLQGYVTHGGYPVSESHAARVDEVVKLMH